MRGYRLQSKQVTDPIEMDTQFFAGQGKVQKEPEAKLQDLREPKRQVVQSLYLCNQLDNVYPQ